MFIFLLSRSIFSSNSTSFMSTRVHVYVSRTKHGVFLLVMLMFAFVIYQRVDINTISNTINTYIWNLTSSEARHIGFLKVHKAGGSTIQNILFRFGRSRNATFVIPVEKSIISEYNKPSDKLLNYKNGDFYDILALHTVYNESVYSKLLPKDSFRLAIVRKPLDVFVSAAFYHRDVWGVDYLQRVPNDNFIHNLILYPELYDSHVLSLTRNSMAMDFGFPPGIHSTETKTINNYLCNLDRHFHLVMVLEKFDESLILLKRLLGWQLKDILYIPQNTHSHPSISELNISQSEIDKFETRNFLDVALYDHFVNIFNSKVNDLGQDFKYEVEHFQNVGSKVLDYCVFHERHSNSRDLVVYESDWNAEFSLSLKDCEDMMRTELDFISRIRKDIKKKLRGILNKTISL